MAHAKRRAADSAGQRRAVSSGVWKAAADDVQMIMGEHRATSGQGNLPSLRQRERDSGDLLVQRVKAHDATSPSRGSHTCRT